MPKLSFEYDGKIYGEMTPEQLVEAGVPQVAIDAALTGLRIADIKIECGRLIYAVASAETQMNISAATAVISGKTTTARTDAEKALLAGAEASIGWVAAMR